MSYKIGVVGDAASILPFQILGFDVKLADTGEEARVFIDTMAREGYGVIYVCEHLALSIPETIDRYDTGLVPAVILIPSHKGSLNLGKQRIDKNVEKAVGKNIL